MFLEIKAILRQYFFALNIKTIDYIIYGIVTLGMASIFKILYMLNVKLIFIIIIVLLFIVFLALQNRINLIIEMIKSDKYNLSRIYPIKESNLIMLKTFKYEFLSFIEILSVIIPTFLMLFLVGYNFNILFENLVKIIIIFLFIKNIFSMINLCKINYGIKFVGIIVDAIKIGSIYLMMYIYYLVAKKISVYIYNSGNNLHIEKIMKLIGKLSLEKYILVLNKSYIYIAMVGVCFVLVYLKTKIYISILKKDKLQYEPQIKKIIKKLEFKNISIKKEIRSLINENIFEYMINRILSYILFGIVYEILDVKFEYNYNLIIFALIAEAMYVSEKICKAYLGKEKKFILNYIFSNYSIIKLIIHRSYIYIFIVSIYMMFIESLIGIVFKIGINKLMFFIIITYIFIPVYIISTNIFNTYKTSYENELAMPNRKVSILKLGVQMVFLYSILLAISIVSNININHKELVEFFLILIIGAINLILILAFARIREAEFYGEYKNAFSKKSNNKN